MTEGFVVKVPLPLLLALALLVPPAAARPPEGVSGRMVLDKVADGLRKYRKETDDGRRIEWLNRLAPTKDPRVGVALWEARRDPSLAACLAAHRAYAREFVGGERGESLVQFADDSELRTREWATLGLDAGGMWRYVLGGCGNGQPEEVDHLYRRAKELPR